MVRFLKAYNLFPTLWHLFKFCILTYTITWGRGTMIFIITSWTEGYFLKLSIFIIIIILYLKCLNHKISHPVNKMINFFYREPQWSVDEHLFARVINTDVVFYENCNFECIVHRINCCKVSSFSLGPTVGTYFILSHTPGIKGQPAIGRYCFIIFITYRICPNLTR